MSPSLIHYMSGSCTADWLRMCRAIEAAEDFAALSTGPLLPEPTEDAELPQVPA